MRTAAVTGGARGIGRAIAQALRNEGYSVTVIDRDAEAISQCARALEVRGVACDVTDEESVRRTAAELGALDVLVNNAGVWEYTSFFDTTASQARGVLDVNVMGTFLCTQAFGRHLGQGAAIINVASVSADRVPAGVGMYGPSKAAVVALTKWAAIELGARGIRVNAVSPGMVLTDANAVAFDDGRRAEMAASFPVPGLATPEDVANAVVYLASDAARYITGANLQVDGGYLLLGPMGLRTGVADEHKGEQ